MASFEKKMGKLLAEAQNRGLVEDDAVAAILALSREMEGAGGVGRLATALCIVGGISLLLGFFLLIGANWDGIPALAKLTMYFLLFLGFHAGGLFLRLTRQDGGGGMAEALNFIGGGLFLGGLALISQTFNIHDHAANGVLAWFLATLPLALLLRSPSLTFMAVVAAIIWVHMEADLTGPSTGPLVAIQASMPLLLIGCGACLERLSSGMAKVCRIMGGLWLGGTVYGIGFFRHWYSSGRGAPEADRTTILALFAGAVGLALFLLGKGGRLQRLERWQAVLLAGTFLLGLGCVAVSQGWMAEGGGHHFFNFGRMAYFHATPLLFSVAAWVLWFAWCLWLVFQGGMAHRGSLVSMGVYGTVAGLISRYFDLLGSLALTGTMFFLGGVLLLAVGWSAERWRRRLTERWMQTPS